ncbi:uncharacterized protein LOC126896017 [Daktulosphaira vitifoliae]|uniref:uncharacterized protein LOC126896017 n=1 Tax=Daktulosphaira vitifoliae TaxID=58002 RepID=UPI0021AA39C9|nr:uncharacterized protein LOC126896017 [Daktulosphaira vitifoliae]
MKKDIKKSSYYVWFLGSQECKSIRDVDSIIPIISTLSEREKKAPPSKFTLQVSHRGLKIVHSASAQTPLPGGKISKSDLVKHLIPDHAITCVHRNQDLVAVILLLYNPVTKWPVHVHVYRCDSVETATLLSGQLQTLINRPENIKKLDEIESRLSIPEPPPLSKYERKRESPLSSSSESGIPITNHVTTLYDSLAAELKKKLDTGKSGAPILLPPRDYDTVHRHRGNLTGIDLRRCMSSNIVGVNAIKKDTRRSTPKMGSSGDSSGIGSDHAPSPEQYEQENTYVDNNSSSDEDWNIGSFEEPLVKSTTDHPMPRVKRQDSGVDSNTSPLTSPEKDYYSKQEHINANHFRKQNHNISSDIRDKYSDRNVALVQPRLRNSEVTRKPSAANDHRRKPVETRQRSPSPDQVPLKESPKERFKDAKEKFLMMEKERIDEQRIALKKCLERQRKDIGPAMIREIVRSSNWSKKYGSDDEADHSDRYRDDFKDDFNYRNDRRSNRSKESFDYDYESYPKPVTNRHSRIQHEREHGQVPRSYSDDYLEQNNNKYRSSSSENRFVSPQRRATEVPRAAPRRNPVCDNAPLRPDYKRRSTAPYEEGNTGHERTRDTLQENSLLVDGPSPSREYKRRSAAYAYEDHRVGAYSKRELEKRIDDCSYPLTSAPISPRYRHSYAEPYHKRNHQPTPLPPQDPMYRHQASGRIGIAAIHHY